MDRRDSLGVCVDNQKGAESLQRDQAVCISTNGTLTHTHTHRGGGAFLFFIRVGLILIFVSRRRLCQR